MNKFNAQLHAIHPSLVEIFMMMFLENAREYIDGYNGGWWDEALSVGTDLYIIRCTCGDAKGNIRLINGNNYCDVTTDVRTAGAALTILTMNHLIWALHEMERMIECEQVSDLWDKIQDASREEVNNFDVSAILSFTD